MTDCLFCKIASGDINTNLIYQDDKVVAFHDINPQAPQHILVIPRKHIATLNDVADDDRDVVSQLLFTAKQIAEQLNIAENGYRTLINCNRGGGQEVYHLHLHLLGGRQMQWPPG